MVIIFGNIYKQRKVGPTKCGTLSTYSCLAGTTVAYHPANKLLEQNLFMISFHWVIAVSNRPQQRILCWVYVHVAKPQLKTPPIYFAALHVRNVYPT
jgi:hypothetical protein